MSLPSSSIVVLGLGANLGEPRETLRRAVREIAGWGDDFAVSSLYSSAPIGPPQPDYLNAAVRLTTADGPEAILERCHDLEARERRVRREHWGPRTLDVDVLWIEGVVMATTRLQIPHPHLTARAFALVPLLEIAPRAVDPRSGHALSESLQVLGASGMVRVADDSWADGSTRG